MLGQLFSVTFLSKKVMRLEFWQVTSPPSSTGWYNLLRGCMWCRIHAMFVSSCSHQSCVLCCAAADFLASKANAKGCACEDNRRQPDVVEFTMHTAKVAVIWLRITNVHCSLDACPCLFQIGSGSSHFEVIYVHNQKTVELLMMKNWMPNVR